MTEARAIAEKLSEAQRAAVLAIEPAGTWADDHPASTPLFPAYEACLASRAWCPGYRYQLTPLGLEVRRYLIGAA